MTSNKLARKFYPSHPLDRSFNSLARQFLGYDPWDSVGRLLQLMESLPPGEEFEEKSSTYVDRTPEGDHHFAVWTKGTYPKIRVTKEMVKGDKDYFGTLKSLTILAAVPGVPKERISMGIQNGVITIEIEKQKEEEMNIDHEVSTVINEIPDRYSKLEVGISGGNFNWEGVTAELEDHGILRIYLPALEKPKTPRLEIKGK